MVEIHRMAKFHLRQDCKCDNVTVPAQILSGMLTHIVER